MASPPPPSEEERRLLREYRLVTVPSRRSSCSPATSNASSLTTTTTNINNCSANLNASNLIDQSLSEPQLAGVSQTGHRPANSGKSTPSATHCNSSCNQSQSSPSTASPPITRQIDCQTSSTNTVATTTTTTPKASYGSGSSRHSSSSPSPNFINQNSHHHSSSNHHNNCNSNKPHGRHHHPRKHKAGAAHLVELSVEDLNQMLDLVSNLSFLKLVSPKTISPNGADCSLANTSEDANCNSTGVKNSPATSGCDADDDNRSSSNDQHNHHHRERVSGRRNGHLLANLMSRHDCEPLHIFEKVDYIKKLNIRRKALKRMKKNEMSKSRRTPIVMPNINESPKIM